jgi:cytochrome c2
MRPSSIAPTLAALAIAVLVAPTLAAAQDAAHGKAVFSAKCATCHSVAAGRTLMGPSLDKVVGRRAGSAAGYNYSPAFAASTVVWSTTTLDAYLTNPKAFIPKNRMSMPGLSDPKDRADLIAYLTAQN